MPPHGLYPVPRHHQYHASPYTARPAFNTMDFGHDRPEAEPPTEAQAPSSKNKVKRKKKKEHRKSLVVESTHGLANDSAMEKKRKRSSENSTAFQMTPISEQRKDSSLLHAGFLETLKSTMGDLGASFDQTPSKHKADLQPVLKKHKSQPDFGTKAPFKRPNKYDENGQKLPKKVGRPSNEELMARDNGTVAQTKKPKREHGHRRHLSTSALNVSKTAGEATPLGTPSQTLAMHKTPIPLPAKSPVRASAADSGLRKLLGTHTRSDGVSDIPAPPSQPLQTPTTEVQQGQKHHSGRKKAKKGPTIDISPSSAIVDRNVSAPMISNKGQQKSQDTFTSATLMEFKRTPILGQESRRRIRRPSLSSSLASSLSASVKDYYVPVNKPYIRSGAEVDPFVAPPTKKKQRVETHEEADLATFTARFRENQKSVNFTDEHEYLVEYSKWKTAYETSGKLPCLSMSTGCNSKREQILALSKEDTSDLLKVSLADAQTDTSVLDTAVSAANLASQFLKQAIITKTPVPVGKLEGVWKLYCPKYSATHIDRYAFGQRTLTIATLAGSKDATYTARLSIPPRSMAFIIASFQAPPHASLRTTSLTATSEGCRMEVVFLGNGYLTLRADLHLLLMGKASDGGNGVMEFLGVHETAVKWEKQVDELEEYGQKAFRKYDGKVDG
ncbi:hypothetical protein ACN47E_005072 [Coniothyrium glycines]